MKRYALDKLLQWKDKTNQKPLIIRGARQVGKTWLMKEFSKHFNNSVYINFDKNPQMETLFSTDLNVKRIIENLSIATNTNIDTDTLIIFDEIQECPRALTSLKYFNEDAPQYKIVAAGSLLGIALHQGTSFPVGKVDFLDLHPLSFYEFLQALDQTKLIEIIKTKNFEMIDYYHDTFVDLLKQYMFVGGMPEVVQNFILDKDFNNARQIQTKILEAYELDFSKHAPENIAVKIRLIMQSTSKQLSKENKKFIYGMVKEGSRAKDLETAMQWLLDCSILHKINRTSKCVMPLKFYEDVASFKIYLLDVGLMSAMCNLSVNALFDKTAVFEEFKGALTEQFVLGALVQNGQDNFYWSPDSGKAELDFITQVEDKIVAIEVKSSQNLQSKSLKVFIDKYPQAQALRTSLAHFRKEQTLTNIPLYLMESFKLFI